ncbi:hypothetical protein G7068_03275 [Leucobacter viscericola]|uniref:Uncharacterized protein n=1 Tax=Leucobacter viscericola TaxID=2714935 RepID=A0A6G7XCY7_9MICO|nr:hypothetical protein [Leucobacter viscericola]QIK62336.1 hypothetical protein G7068_03275 [Leucobacter viscericola]
MVDFEAPYAMDGTRIPAEGLRRQLQREAGTGSGVVRPGDLRISQLDVPGTGVKIAAGDDLIQSRESGRGRETYGIPLLTAQNYMGDGGQGIPGTGSTATRRDMIIHEILDPIFAKTYTPRDQWPEGATSKLSVVPGVPATAKTVAEVPALAGVTAYELAAINWPKSTGTITNAMLEDLRRLQSPRTDTAVRSINLTAAGTGDRVPITDTQPYPGGGQTYGKTGGQTWPVEAETSGRLDIAIPDWANYMAYTITWSQLSVLSGNGNAYGNMWLQVGANVDPTVWRGEASSWDIAETAGSHTMMMRVADTNFIPANLRGRTMRFYPRVNLTGGKSAASPRLTWATSFDLTVTFLERAV